ncbi:hypothetical protein KC842_01350 [Candidatus Nomurabacteria bacterium]|nr:hypothetical protein [Candidatus Nomurabacteria bacterium]USN94592.1 MAG: hypothetical protein H6791_02420 [Candidatus Nomurabacteria bacterium]
MKFWRKIKDTFLPHKGNDHKPLILGEKGLFAVIVVAVIFSISGMLGKVAIEKGALSALVQSSVLVDLANEDRVDQNISPLTINESLVLAAELKATDMATKEYFAHTSPDGITPWYWIEQTGYDFSYAGENLAVDFSESKDVNEAWMNSTLHRQNILNEKFTEIGIATASGYYKGRKTTFVVQMFGTPRGTSIALANSTKTEDILVEEISENVKGEEISVDQNLEVIYDTPTFLAVENISTEEPVVSIQDEEVVVQNDLPEDGYYSTKVDRYLASPSTILRIMYGILFLLVLVPMLLMLVVEFKKKHYKHMLLGLVTLVVIAFLFQICDKYIFDLPIII